ncbi:hypothetical protein [Cysteiniphilum halobium]|uniref:hypothetical protein n=1 Tax=Cysteiniphilum halobium TaxID=2219059 RepID=UPI000E64703A|nr:hypothetical protein [Cysteiniphilum halobium]
MATINDLLNRKKFEPKKSRSWDYLKEIEETQNNSETISKSLGNNNNTIGKQKENNSETISKSLGNNNNTIGKQKENNSETISKSLGNNNNTIGKQNIDKLDSNFSVTEAKSAITNLSGIQKKIFKFIVSELNSNLETDIITSKKLLEIAECNADTLKVLIGRLYKKGLILKSHYKTGKGGFRKFKLSKVILKAFEESEQISESYFSKQHENKTPIYNSNTTNTINKYSNDTKEQKSTTPQNDQLIKLIKQQNDKIAELQKQFLQQTPQVQPETKTVTVTEATETTTSESDNDNWTDLDFSSLTEFGFNKRHVTQIKNFNKSLDVDNQLTVDSVQESIEHYAWALQNRLDEMASYAPANNRLRGLIGVLKKGGNWTEANYKSPEDLAFEASLKAKEERLLKLKEQKERVFNLEFELWCESLTATELTDIEEKGELQGKMPPSAFKNKGDNKHYVAALKTYFKNNVYGGL